MRILTEEDRQFMEDKFRACRVCNQPLGDSDFQLACRNFQGGVCSPSCRASETKARFACCPQAEFSSCVCFVSFTCPTHGSTHIGTHD